MTPWLLAQYHGGDGSGEEGNQEGGRMDIYSLPSTIQALRKDVYIY